MRSWIALVPRPRPRAARRLRRDRAPAARTVGVAAGQDVQPPPAWNAGAPSFRARGSPPHLREPLRVRRDPRHRLPRAARSVPAQPSALAWAARAARTSALCDWRCAVTRRRGTQRRRRLTSSLPLFVGCPSHRELLLCDRCLHGSRLGGSDCLYCWLSWPAPRCLLFVYRKTVERE
jgi:hypothetical protein